MFCASGTIDITPDFSLQLAGYFDRKILSQGVVQRLEANAVLLSDGKNCVMFISADLLYFGKELSDFLLDEVSKYGLKPESLVLTASHTHFSPATDSQKPGLGAPDDFYMENLKRQFSKLIDDIFSAPLQKVKLSHSCVTTNLNVNRRVHWKWPTLSRAGIDFSSKILMAPNTQADKDDFIDVLRVESEVTGDLVSVLWKFACHPVAFPDRNFVTSEYPGICRDSIRGHVGFKLPVVFWQGFSGDVRPMLQGKPQLGGGVRTWVKGPGFRSVSRGEWVSWTQKLASLLISTLDSPERSELNGELSMSSKRIPLSDLLCGEGVSGKDLTLSRVAVDASMEFIFISAEVCSPYLSILANGSSRTVFVGYAGDVFGYLPSEGQAKAKGYEGEGFLTFFGYNANFSAGFERRVLDAVTDLRSKYCV